MSVESIAHNVVFKTRLSTGHENENRTIEQMNHHNGFEIVDRRLKNIDNVFLYLDEIFYNICNSSAS